VSAPSPADLAALRRTAELYAIGADRRDKDLWRQILAPDCIIEGPGFRTKGLDLCLGSIDGLAQMFHATHHRVDHLTGTVEGQLATGETWGCAEHLLPERNELLVWAIRYQDNWCRSGGAWLFTHRRLVIDWQEMRPVLAGDTP
jgi:SnoaL-like domain